jgi:hypothetical protein
MFVAHQSLGRSANSRAVFVSSEEPECCKPQNASGRLAPEEPAFPAKEFSSADAWSIGIYWLVDIVTGPPGYPAAILISGVEGVQGPGRVTRRFGIDREFNDKKADEGSRLWLEDRGVVIDPRTILETPRIGVTYAGPTWANKRYRFVLRSLEG